MGCRVSLNRFLKLWGPVIVWAALIFALSSVPSLNSGLGTWDEVLRKCAHVTEYAILGFLLLRAIGRELPALLLGIAYAATDEFHQHFVAGRHGSSSALCSSSASFYNLGVPEGKDLSDRQLEAILERLDRLCEEVRVLNRRLDSGDQLLRIARELSTLNESLQTLAYAALGQQGPQVRRRRSA
jgi:hypothetical protein